MRNMKNNKDVFIQSCSKVNLVLLTNSSCPKTKVSMFSILSMEILK